MKKNIFALGIASVLALSLLAGCSGQKAGTPDTGDAARKPVVNFEGVVTAAEDGTLTLDSGKTVVITDRTEFAPDPDSDGTVSRDIAVGNYIQGYTADGADDEKVTAENIWTNTVPAGGKMAVNFEGRVSAAEDGRVTLEDGRTVLISGSTSVAAPDGTAADIAAGDYIQGYADNPEDSELNARSILITAL